MSTYSDAACTGKQKLHQRRAQEIAAGMRRRDGNASAYRCIVCGQWHVGSKPKGMKGARPAYSSRTRARFTEEG